MIPRGRAPCRFMLSVAEVKGDLQAGRGGRLQEIAHRAPIGVFASEHTLFRCQGLISRLFEIKSRNLFEMHTGAI